MLLGFLFAGDLFFWHLAIMNTSITNATLLATTTPLVVAFGAWLILKEKITREIMMGVIAGMIGAALLMGASATFKPENLYGDISAMGSVSRFPYIHRVLKNPKAVDRVILGSDFPVPVSPMLFASKIGFWRAREISKIKNPIQKNPPNDDGMTTAETDKG